MSLHWRPADNISRILAKVRDSTGRFALYCVPLGQLRPLRHESCLQLCRMRRSDTDNTYVSKTATGPLRAQPARAAGDTELVKEQVISLSQQADAPSRDDHEHLEFHPCLELEFGIYESTWSESFVLTSTDSAPKSMVLFCSAFTAVKSQEKAELPSPALRQEHDLPEIEEFGVVVKDRGMLYELRLLHDRASGVVRLEASLLRGPREGTPVWMAFVTRYTSYPDWVALENDGVVSLIELSSGDLSSCA